MASACKTELGLAGASANLADPFDCAVDDMKIGRYRRMGDGTLKGDFAQNPNKKVWNLQWVNLEGTPRGTIRTEAIRTGSMFFTSPYDATIYSILATTYGERAKPSAEGSVRWDVRLRLEEL